MYIFTRNELQSDLIHRRGGTMLDGKDDAFIIPR
jgi:hypothetical protein